jgi:hypothetical protein
MAGAGTHLHRLIRTWTGEGFSASCGCKAMMNRMDEQGPDWCRANVEPIVSTMRKEARKRGIWKYLALMPGATTPMRWLVWEAIRRSEQDGR